MRGQGGHLRSLLKSVMFWVLITVAAALYGQTYLFGGRVNSHWLMIQAILGIYLPAAALILEISVFSRFRFRTSHSQSYYLILGRVASGILFFMGYVLFAFSGVLKESPATMPARAEWIYWISLIASLVFYWAQRLRLTVASDQLCLIAEHVYYPGEKIFLWTLMKHRRETLQMNRIVRPWADVHNTMFLSCKDGSFVMQFEPEVELDIASAKECGVRQLKVDDFIQGLLSWVEQTIKYNSTERTLGEILNNHQPAVWGIVRGVPIMWHRKARYVTAGE